MSFFEPKTPKNQGISANQSGSAIIWIFVMVVLFAALTFAVSKGSRSGSSQLTEKQAELAAVEILDYARNIKNAVQQLQINGCDETEVSFDQAVISGYSNPNSPTDESCNVFSNNGGGMRFSKLNTSYLDQSESAKEGFGEPFISQRMRIPGVGCDGGPGICQELTIVTPYIKHDVCLNINKKLGIGNIVEQDSGWSVRYFPAWKFNGTYDGNGVLNGTTLYNNLYAGCFEGDAQPPGGYHFYQVLIAR